MTYVQSRSIFYCVFSLFLHWDTKENTHFWNIFFISDSTSFFSAQLSQSTEVAHGGTVLFDNVVVNYGSDYIQTGGIYM